MPLLQGFVIAGEFDILGKIWYSLRVNLLFYAGLFALLSIVIVYMKLATTVNTWQGIAAFLMALSNAVGLLAVIMLLGHGLVRVPQRLWHASNSHRRLRKLEANALAFNENLQEAEEDLASAIREIGSLPYKTRHRPDLQPYVDLLLNSTPVPTDDELLASSYNLRGAINNGGVQPALNLHYLEHLNYRLRETLSRRDRAAWEWRNLCEMAWHYQDVKSNRQGNTGRLWTSNVEVPDFSRWRRSLRWWWNVHIRFALYKCASVFCIFLSCIVVWSEITLVFADLDLSLVSRLVHWSGASNAVIETVTVSMLLYLAVCAYSTFLKMKVLSYFRLVPGRHTDEKSLLFFAAYLTRLTFPLGYNYLTLLEGGSANRTLITEFSNVMGKMDLFPVLGRYFNLYVPLGLAIICTLVSFRMLGHLFNSDLVDSAEESIFEDEGELIDGRELIAQARRLEERENHARLRMYSSSLANWRFNRSYSEDLPSHAIPPRSETRTQSPPRSKPSKPTHIPTNPRIPTADHGQSSARRSK